MITALSGIVIDKTDNSIVLHIGPVQISIFVSRPDYYTLHLTTTILTHLHFQELIGFSLFGFQKEYEKILFLELLACRGVGPKLALTILGNMEVHDLITTIQTNNIDQITTIPGIGQKKGEQMLLSLKHSLKKIEPFLTDINTTSNISLFGDIEKTLSALCYSKAEIQKAIRVLKDDKELHKSHPDGSFDLFLRYALKYLSSHN